MSNKILFVLLFLFQFGFSGLSQETIVRAEYGLGTFNMSDLKAFQTANIPDLGVEVKRVSSFPPYFNYGLSFIRYFKTGIGVGVTSEFFSTGGRNYYGDYSGSYNFDLLTHCFNLGTILSIRNTVGKSQNLNFEILQGLKLSSLDISEKLIVTYPIIDESLKLHSNSWWIKAGLHYEFSFLKYYQAGAFAGGEFNLKSRLRSKENSDLYLVNENGEYTKINWSGLRFALSLSVNLSAILK